MKRLFLSTPSARRATEYLGEVTGCGKISIHALREEGDSPTAGRSARTPYFYPRPPRGGRRNQVFQSEMMHQFLSTPSARRATLQSG